MKKKIFFPNLDGLRFFCFLMVFLYHSGATDDKNISNHSLYKFVFDDLFGNGDFGVNFFFVLSGFLITYLLIEEKKIRRINVIAFWKRRILRIWPLFYACVFFGFIIFPFLKSFFGEVPNETANPLYYLLFINNFDVIAKGLPDSSVLGVLWSVAIEEQFYFVWPVILLLTRRKHLWIVFTTIILASFIFRINYSSEFSLHFHTLSCISDMAVGAFGAWLIHHSQKFKDYIANLNSGTIIFTYFLFLILFLFSDEFGDYSKWFLYAERLIVSIVMLIIILEQCFSTNSFYKMSEFNMISKLGIITYGLYCLHFIGILITTTASKKLGINPTLWSVVIGETIVSLIITILISKLSFRYFETPFLKLKDRFAVITK